MSYTLLQCVGFNGVRWGETYRGLEAEVVVEDSSRHRRFSEELTTLNDGRGKNYFNKLPPLVCCIDLRGLNFTTLTVTRFNGKDEPRGT